MGLEGWHAIRGRDVAIGSAPRPRAPRRRPACTLLASLAALTLVAVGRVAAAQMCPGDCDASGVVTASDLVRMVAVALGNLDLASCAAGDADGDGRIDAADIITAVHSAFGECPDRPATYDVLAGGAYDLAFPTRAVSAEQAAIIVAGLERAGLQNDEEALQALLAQLLADAGVRDDRLGVMGLFGQR